MEFAPKIIAVDGAIGVGKSTFLATLRRVLGDAAIVVPEALQWWQRLKDSDGNTHNLLKEYYEDAARHASAFQQWTLFTRVQSLKEAYVAAGPSVKYIFVERSLFGDEAFARMLHKDGKIGDAWFAAYKQLQTWLREWMPSLRPNLVLYLDVPPEIAYERMRARDRLEESSVSLAYEQRLVETTVEILKEAEACGTHIVRLDATKIDVRHEERVMDMVHLFESDPVPA